MSDAVAGRLAAHRPVSGGLLSAAATFWFFVTLAGQWVFLYYIAAFYGPGALSGDFETWNRHPFIDNAIILGDAAGNLAFAAHVLLAATIALGGTLQLVPQIRARAIAFHRWNGRVFMTAAILASVAGLYMVWIRGHMQTGIVGAMSITLNAALVLLFAAVAWRAAASRDITRHRRWAMRTFMVTNGVFWLRLLFPGWVVITQAEPSAITFHLLSFASYLLPWALLELYLYAKDNGGVAARWTAAGVVFAASGYMIIGLFGFYMIFVQRILSAA
jgi:uncharacterized membrane protein